MRHCIFYLILFITCIFISCDKKPNNATRLLIFSKTAGFRHTSIPNGITAIMQLGKDNMFEVEATENAAMFTKANLQRYAAVVFLNTTGDVLTDQQQSAFEDYIRNGGGYAGVHAASDTEHNWPWYGKLTGAYFDSHPEIQEAKLMVTDRTHSSTKHLSEEWIRKDEWYNFKDLNPAVNYLINIDEQSYTGGSNGDPHPICWYHEYEGGRSWYTALGHTEESYDEPEFLTHLLGGIQYAMGLN